MEQQQQQLRQHDQHQQQQQKPDPLALVVQVCRAHLSTDDVLAARCVCKAWRSSLSTGVFATWRLPHSLWSNADAASNQRLACTVAAAAAAYAHSPHLLLDASSGCRPGLREELWPALCAELQPWLAAAGAASKDGQPPCARGLQLRLAAPPSPQQLACLTSLRVLAELQVMHTHLALYSRHLSSLACLTQLQALELCMVLPKLELRSLAHQRMRRTPLRADCLSSLVRLTRLDMASRGHTGELLPDTVAAFRDPASLAVLTGLRHLGLCEAALHGPQPTMQWLAPLTALTSLLLVQLDDPSLVAARIKAAAAAGAGCATSASGVLGAGGSSSGGGGFGAALTAAAEAAGRTDQHAQAQQLLQTAQGLIPGLASLASAASAAAAAVSGRGVAGSSGGGSSSSAAAAPPGRPASSADGAPDPAAHGGGGAGPHVSDAAAAAAAAVAAAGMLPMLPPLDVAASLPRLQALSLANMAGDRLIRMAIPPGLTRLVLHLAHPCPGAVTGEQLAAVILQAARRLEELELGLGMRFSLSGVVMRDLKRGLPCLRGLTLIEGAADHLEGLGCWCNLPRLSLIEGRCSVPLRGLYELSMRAAMGRTPGCLSYSGHVRHLDELASRLGAAVQALRLDSLAGLGGGSSGSGGGGGRGLPQGLLEAGKDGGADGDDDDGSSTQSGGEGDADGGAGVPAAPRVPALAQLTCLRQLEVMGDAIGQLDAAAAHALAWCTQLRTLCIEARGEAWLCPGRGVKEQLGWLGELRQLRQLRLAGVMLGRCKLSAAASSPHDAAPAGAASGEGGSTAAAAATSSGSNTSTRLSPGGGPVKGLVGNGLPSTPGALNPAATNSSSSSSKAIVAAGGCTKQATAGAITSSSSSSGGAVAAAPAGPLVRSSAAVQGAASAAAWDASVASSLEELRRWLCELLPECRVWLD